MKRRNFVLCDCLFQSSDSGGFRARRRSPQAIAMATLSLRISIPEKNATKMMQFDPSTSVYDACRIIREKLAEATNMGQRKGLIFYLSRVRCTRPCSKRDILLTFLFSTCTYLPKKKTSIRIILISLEVGYANFIRLNISLMSLVILYRNSAY